jgi:hypothetical protein
MEATFFNQRDTQVRINCIFKNPCKTDPLLSPPPHFARAQYHQLNPPKPPGVSQREGCGHTRRENSASRAQLRIPQI